MSDSQSTKHQPRVALVTGGSRGLGRSCIENLAARGVDIIFTFLANRQEADAACATIRRAGRRAVAIKLDTGEVADFDAFIGKVKQALAELGSDRVDYLVNNAGNSHHAPIADTTEADFDKLYRVHLKGVFFLTQKMLPLLRDGGRIVNISSGLARFAFPGSAPYAMMKGGVEVLTRYLAKELGPRGIVVNTVAPGAIATDFSGGMVRDNPDINRQVASMSALGRVGVVEDIGPMIASLLSEDHRWVNAQRIEVSGGTLI